MSGSPLGANAQNWEWAYQILPYLEQGVLWEDSNDANVAASNVKTYSCPWLRPPTKYPYSQSTPTVPCTR